ncbi:MULTISPECIES: hypothetical protein [Rhodococcus]|jgi:hypothetical protein|uniref:Uncharacterized protein n=1 Tax=Rhodococcus maanshanensis TaxID=183556 RepID=A0A1H7TIF4_9NOCA|nr:MULTISPECIES: hypothetical protein [Rhodococcus]MBP1161815.1 hypothetical protein [Rhodococcus sp. PvR099]MCZ4555559.1 hypothetical protein [Rhodococcus maanshanensis]PTR37166.1 hypothetical protein C8K38_12153 [Rhodococcus sp. OK611]SEL83597.1 hypothetical protein SAMN05444583_115129 [Rhodococcus maanshanensis]SNX93499.1 hypothetical protein SAMN05447004_12153 [Rhodococcus sp. OK270]
MSTKITKTLAATAIALTVGVFAAPAASASDTVAATPALGSVALCFSVPLGSAALVWCI